MNEPRQATPKEDRIAPGDIAGVAEHFLDVVTPEVLASVDDRMERSKAWRAALYEHGLAGLGYPVADGGHGGTEADLEAWKDASAGRIPREDAVFGIGIGMVLPTIRDLGAAHLRQRFVRPGLRGEEVWCQLYSEPGAGSDLAALQTRAELDGDEWVITGQKVWTSGAHQADLAVLLARTNPTAPKHQGITLMIVPMRQPGVEVRPLRQMTGEVEFNEVFLDEARAPKDWIIGEVDAGWRTGVALLAHERVQTGVGSMDGDASRRSKSGRSPLPFPQLVELAGQHGRLDDPEIRQQLARIRTGELVMRTLRTREVHPSVGKLWRTRQGRAAADLAARLAFPAGPAWADDDVDADYWNHHILNCRGMSLGGGTDEIQRNTLGERVLGLPRDPKP